MKSGRNLSVTVGTSSGPFVGTGSRRKGLLITVPAGVRVTISDKQNATMGDGLLIENQTAPYKLDYD